MKLAFNPPLLTLIVILILSIGEKLNARELISISSKQGQLSSIQKKKILFKIVNEIGLPKSWITFNEDHCRIKKDALVSLCWSKENDFYLMKRINQDHQRILKQFMKLRQLSPLSKMKRTSLY